MKFDFNRMGHRAGWAAVMAAIFLLGSAAVGQVSVTTWHNDVSRDGMNTHETVLNTTNVNSSQFGKICSATVDGQIYAQPLVVTHVTISGKAYPSVTYVVTQNDSVYAFDSNSPGPTCTQLLFTNLLQTGEYPVNCTYFGGEKCGTVNPVIGILGTPVIDPTNNVMYLVAQSQVGSGQPTSYIHRVHALNISTFAEMFNGPVQVAGTYQNITFTSSNHIQRPGLLLEPGSPSKVYIAYSKIDGSSSDPSGWIFRYDGENLNATPTIFATAPNGSGAGIWQDGAGLAMGVDSEGGRSYLFFGTADGTFDAASGGPDYGDSFIKLSTDLSTVEGYFTPFTQACMFTNDEDYGSGGVVLIPAGLVPAYPYIAVSGDKEGTIYVVDRGTPGGYGGSLDCLGVDSNVQTITGLPQIHNTPAYWNGSLFFAPTQPGPLSRYTISASCSPGPICTTPLEAKVDFPGGVTPSISVNGSTVSSAILWTIWGDRYTVGGPAAVLYAFEPGTMAEIYGSNQCGTADVPGPAVKFSVPTIANGKVMIGTQTDFDIYGELASSRTCQ
ncbi:MAG: hypothetical protein WAK21_09325 [Candidatus Sulfotelmatobacter sp.]